MKDGENFDEMILMGPVKPMLPATEVLGEWLELLAACLSSRIESAV